jgi:transcriptional regulator of acetoin/glycerol metabolism
MDNTLSTPEPSRAPDPTLPQTLRRVPSVSSIVNLEELRTLADLEKHAILYAMQQAKGKPEKAALRLGLGTATVYRKLKVYKLRSRMFR